MDKADYKGFVLHVRELNDKCCPVDRLELTKLAKKYNCPIPKNN